MATGGAERRISKLQLVELFSEIECELQEPMLTRAIDMMDPIGAAESMAPSTPRVDFGNFYVWWTTSNFADPKGFSDSLRPMMSEPQQDGGPSEPFLDEFGEEKWLPRPTSSRVSLRYCTDMVQRGDGCGSQQLGVTPFSDDTFPAVRPSPRFSEDRGPLALEGHTAEHPEAQRARSRRRSLDAGLGGGNKDGLLQLMMAGGTEEEEGEQSTAELSGTVRKLASNIAGVEAQMKNMERGLNERACLLTQSIRIRCILAGRVFLDYVWRLALCS